MRTSKSDLLQRIVTEKQLTDEMIEELRKSVEEFKRSMWAGGQAA